jgi:hypothetical protein
MEPKPLLEEMCKVVQKSFVLDRCDQIGIFKHFGNSRALIAMRQGAKQPGGSGVGQSI